MSVGGIFCSVGVGRLLDAKVLDSVNRRSYMYFGEKVLYDHELEPIIAETLLRSATYSMKYVSTRGGRDFNNDTIDLMKSMGVVVYNPKGEIVLYQSYSASGAHREQEYSTKVKFGMLGALGVSEIREHSRNKKRNHPDPVERFESFIQFIPNSHSYRGSGWSVAFVASMPYAVRLEHELVPGFYPHGGFGKRVLIGNINSVVNAFQRKFGRVIGVKYGYIFETTGEKELIRS